MFPLYAVSGHTLLTLRAPTPLSRIRAVKTSSATGVTERAGNDPEYDPLADPTLSAADRSRLRREKRARERAQATGEPDIAPSAATTTATPTTSTSSDGDGVKKAPPPTAPRTSRVKDKVPPAVAPKTAALADTAATTPTPVALERLADPVVSAESMATATSDASKDPSDVSNPVVPPAVGATALSSTEETSTVVSTLQSERTFVSQSVVMATVSTASDETMTSVSERLSLDLTDRAIADGACIALETGAGKDAEIVSLRKQLAAMDEEMQQTDEDMGKLRRELKSMKTRSPSAGDDDEAGGIVAAAEIQRLHDELKTLKTQSPPADDGQATAMAAENEGLRSDFNALKIKAGEDAATAATEIEAARSELAALQAQPPQIDGGSSAKANTTIAELRDALKVQAAATEAAVHTAAAETEGLRQLLEVLKAKSASDESAAVEAAGLTDSLQKDLDQLRAEAAANIAAAATAAASTESLQKEMDTLRAQSSPAKPPSSIAATEEVEKLREEVAFLRGHSPHQEDSLEAQIQGLNEEIEALTASLEDAEDRNDASCTREVEHEDAMAAAAAEIAVLKEHLEADGVEFESKTTLALKQTHEIERLQGQISDTMAAAAGEGSGGESQIAALYDQVRTLQQKIEHKDQHGRLQDKRIGELQGHLRSEGKIRDLGEGEASEAESPQVSPGPAFDPELEADPQPEPELEKLETHLDQLNHLLNQEDHEVLIAP